VPDLATAATKALRVRTGFLHTEIKVTPSGPRVIEVNGRLGGGLPNLLQQAAGFDLLRALGRDPITAISGD